MWKIFFLGFYGQRKYFKIIKIKTETKIRIKNENENVNEKGGCIGNLMN